MRRSYFANGRVYSGLKLSCVATHSLMIVACDLLKKDHEIFIPLNSSSSCDLITIKNSKTYRYEVKTNNGSPTVHQKIKNKFDILARVKNGEVFYTPIKIFMRRLK